MNTVMKLQSGKKAIVLGVAMAAYGALGFFLQDMGSVDALRWVSEGLGIVFLRLGISKIDVAK